MNRIGAHLVLVLAAVGGCSVINPVLPVPSRVEELLSLARVQDPASEGTMAEALKSGTTEEREVAAFGLGQLGAAWEPPPDEVRKSAEDALVAALASEAEAAVRERIIEALGKVGREAGFAALTPLLAADKPAPERARAAIALSFISRNAQMKSTGTRDAMMAMLEDGDATVRFAGAYGLVRYRDPASKGALLEGLSDSDPLVRATCLKAFVTLGAPADAPELGKLVEDADDRVAAEAARTLTRLAMQCTTDDCPALDALVASPGPWRPAVMQAVSAEVWVDARAVPLFEKRFDEYAQAMMLDEKTRGLMQCQAALGHDRAAGGLVKVPQCGGDAVSEVQRNVLAARVLVATKNQGPEFQVLLESDSFLVRGAAVPGASALALPGLLADPDPIVTGAAAARAEELMAADLGPDLVAALQRLIGPDAPADAQEGVLALLSALATLDVKEATEAVTPLLDAEPYAVRQAAAHTLTALTGEMKVARLPAPLGPAPEIGETTVRVTTSRGDIRIRMLVTDAPRTAKNFVDLVEKKFYDGIIIHRVVPNFVAQMGDPRGDGSGGPGYDIPCEINLHRYGAGTVGMALAGRDTGGSQLFIAHSPQPHLDGYYTTFGEVIEGLEVANGLAEGDVIVEARVE